MRKRPYASCGCPHSRDPQFASSKPILLRKVGGKWEVFVNVLSVARYAVTKSARLKKYLADPRYTESEVPVVREGNQVDLIPGGKPSKFTKKEAWDLAHQIGYYLFNLGNFVYTYVEEIQ